MRILARGEARERREERRINTDHRNDLTIQLETQACPLSNRGRELEKSIISRRINWFHFHRFRCQKKISQVVRGVILFDTSVDTFWGRTRRGPVVFRHVNRTNEEPVPRRYLITDKQENKEDSRFPVAPHLAPSLLETIPTNRSIMLDQDR